MEEMSAVKKSIITAVCISFCVVLPQAFHAIPDAGATLCPIHIPVLLCGFICGWPYGLLCGLAGPLLSSLFTGMPSIISLPPMMAECAVYGCITGILIQILNTGRTYIDLYISLISAMLAGRIVAGLVKAFLFTQGEFSIAIWIATYFISSLPGIIIHLILIPNVIFALMKA
ncbi:MAG: ECF transporter S component, partial [Bacillota bacterium]|nr:ECF transporter S component [Bacillota bacterium]